MNQGDEKKIDSGANTAADSAPFIEYNFPPTVWVDQNGFLEQVEHFLSEAQEVREVLALIERSGNQTGMTAALCQRLLEELVDAYHSLETTFRILDKRGDLVSYTFALVEEKNRVRGYYGPGEKGNKQMKWISVKDELPPARSKVIAYYCNSRGLGRTIMAEYIPAFTVLCSDFYSDEAEFESDYLEGDDEGYVKESWHEMIDNWGDFSGCEVVEGVVTHWMPKPLPPIPY